MDDVTPTTTKTKHTMQKPIKINFKDFFLGASLGAVVLLVIAAEAQRTTPAWEFKTVSGAINVKGQRLDFKISKLSAEGWELVGVSGMDDDIGSAFAVMKRPLKP